MITLTLTEPFSTGEAAVSADVPGKWDVALNGRPYMLDTYVSVYTGHSEFMHASVPLLRQQADNSSSPSEVSINPADLWRRSEDSWHKGAGQSFRDRPDSDANRFNTSKGVDVWTKWQISLLPDTTQKRSSANANLYLETAGNRLYLTDGATLKFTTDMTTWTNVTGVPAPAATSICSDGFSIYTAHAASGIYVTDTTSTATASFATGTVSLVGYVKGRLMAAQGNLLYNVIAGGALPAALYTHPNTGFTWVGFAEGPGQIYAAGYAGDKSIIYRTAVKADGTALDIPVVAGQLPDGEIVRSITGYLDFIVVGSDKGVRFADTDGSGNLTFGSLIPTGTSVYCFEGQDRFIWYGLTNYDGTSTGLARLDLSVETQPGTPAYASDLMVTGQGIVESVVTFTNLRVFTVSGLGVYAEAGTKVASGTIDSGQITYALPDDKTAMFGVVRHDLIGRHSFSLSANGGTFVVLGTHTDSDAPFPANQTRGSRFETRLTLTTVGGVSPIIRSVTLKSLPAVQGIDEITAPLLLSERVDTRNGLDYMDPAEELSALKSLKGSSATWQEGDTSYLVWVEDYEWRPTHETLDNTAWNGTIVLKMKVIA